MQICLGFFFYRMRAPVLIAVVLILLACVGILAFHPRPHPAVVADDAGAPAVSNSPATPAVSRPPAPAPVAPPVTPAPPVAETATNGASNSAINPPPDQVYVALAQLDNLAQSGQPDAATQTVDYLNSTNQAIRLAAVEALKQIGDRWVTNNLMEKAAATEDPYEKIAYQKAIDFLKLPTFREQMANPDGAAPQ